MTLTLSIATITLNSEKTLRDTISSVRQQTYPNIEYLIVDGGSTDATLEIIEGQQKHLSRWISEKDDGIYDAMNKAVKMASGDVVGLLNSDDVYASNDVLSRVMQIFEAESQVDMVYGDLVYVDPEDIQKEIRLWTTKDLDANFFSDGLVPPHPTLFVRRKVYEHHQFIKTFQYAADYEFMLRTLHKEKIKSRYLPMVMVRMRLGGQTSKSWRDVLKGNLEIMKAWRLNGLRPPVAFYVKRPVNKLKQFFFRKRS
jgi:glycosyltransferase involved in cell wall biosynthesis